MAGGGKDFRGKSGESREMESRKRPKQRLWRLFVVAPALRGAGAAEGRANGGVLRMEDERGRGCPALGGGPGGGIGGRKGRFLFVYHATTPLRPARPSPRPALAPPPPPRERASIQNPDVGFWPMFLWCFLGQTFTMVQFWSGRRPRGTAQRRLLSC
jgi:hypothetical protein